ncbi:MAG: hypothetical protein PVH40_05930 [Gemmatimonadales bacterium]|jgi:hypothetical protein
MTLTKRRAWSAAVLWAVAGTVFSVSFFSAGGPTQYAAEPVRVLAGAIVLVVAGMLQVWIVRGLLPGADARDMTDERDMAVIARAGQITLMIVLLAVLGSSVALWIGYGPAGQVPVGWMWYLGYGTVILAFLAHALATVFVDARMGGDAGE